MQCLRCGAITADDALDTRYCSNCGAILNEATPQGSPVAAGLPVPPSLPPINSELTVNAGWSEFSGATLAASVPTGAEATYPSSSGFSYSSPNAYPQMVPNDSMVPGAYSSPNLYSQQPVSGTYPPQVAPGGYPYAYAPGFMPPQPPVPKRRSPVLAIVLSVLVILLVAGGVFAGITIGLAHSKTSITRMSMTQTTPTATATPNAQQLYQQVTSQSPSIIDSLQDPTASLWAVYDKPTYGCEIKNDGLHLHIQDTGKYMDCTSDRGKFANFAFQIDMKILSGDGGGIVFRDDSTAGNLYYFHVYPDGGFHLYISSNHQWKNELASGNIDNFNAGSGQTNTLMVIAQGSQISIYVNQKILSQIQDQTYANGYLGVLADDNTAPAEVVYTNAKIWRL